MTTDRILSIRFVDIPIKETFGWNHNGFTKISDHNALDDKGKMWKFPDNFKVDISMYQYNGTCGFTKTWEMTIDEIDNKET